ncbi:unnamed protein product [Boreogadus saida]
MASPRRYGHPARAIADVMQRLQGDTPPPPSSSLLTDTMATLSSPGMTQQSVPVSSGGTSLLLLSLVQGVGVVRGL